MVCSIVEFSSFFFLLLPHSHLLFVYLEIFISNAENADGELADFRDWFDYLSQKCSGQKVRISLF